MKYLFNILIILMVGFVHAECSNIDNQEDCERMDGCEWIESDNMPDGGSCVEGEGDDDEEDWDDGYCSDIDNQETCESTEGCSWDEEESSCYRWSEEDDEDGEEDWEDCSEIDNQEDCERMERCEWSENAGCIEGDSDGEEDWEDCSEIDNQEDCERMERCEWSENAGCIEGDSDGEEDWEDCSEIDNQEECERIDGCEWSDNGDCYGDDGGALENNYPLSYSLSQNYPNPFNPETTINFSIADPGKISLKIYDISGKEINNLINEFYAPGNYSVRWDAIDSHGNQLSSGIYIYQLNTKNGILSNSMMLMK